MTTVKLCTLALCAVMLIIILKQFKPEFVLPVTLTACMIIFAVGLACITELCDFFSYFEIDELSEYLPLMLKALGIGSIATVCADICRDSGENAVASKVEFVAKAEILVLCLPLIKKLLDFSRELLT